MASSFALLQTAWTLSPNVYALSKSAWTCGLNGKAVCTKENEMAIIEHAYAKGYAKANPPKVRTRRELL